MEHDIKASWLAWFQQFPELMKIPIPRHIFAESERRELHVFADASQKAMAAVGYLKCELNL